MLNRDVDNLLTTEQAHESMNSPEFSPKKHLLSQYFWLLLILFSVYFSITRVPTQDSGIINSAVPSQKWSDEIDPIWFGHITDVHLNALNGKTNSHFFDAMHSLSKMSMDDLLISGDLVDNWGEIIFAQYGHQYLPDYVLFNNSVSKYSASFKNIFDMPGNHDEFGIYEFKSPNHLILNFSKYFNRNNFKRIDDYWASSKETDDFIYIFLNPFRFPSPHARFDYFVRPTTEILDFVEKELDKYNNQMDDQKKSKPIIVACHYPMYFWLNTAISSSKKTFREIIKDSRASVYLSGHTHPANSVFQHHDGFLEVVGADVKEHASFSICAFDNGRVSYHTFKKLSDAKIILTHPIPARYTSNRNAFSERDTSVRILVFSKAYKNSTNTNNEALLDHLKNLNIKVRGAVEGKLVYQREVKPGVFLYSLPFSLDDGYHTIEFYGDWNYECDFYVGSKIASFKEIRYGFVNLFSTAIIYSVVSTIVNFIILLPINLTLDNFINSWLGEFFFYTIGGFLAVRFRIQCLPYWLRMMLFLAFLAPLFLPISLVEDEGHYGFNCVYGYFFDGVFVYDIWGQIICMVYEVCIVLFASLFASGMAVSQPWSNIFLIDGFVGIIGLIISFKSLNRLVIESSGPFLTYLSPLFVFVPIVLYLSILFWRLNAPDEFFRDWRNSKKDTKKKVD